VIRVEEPTGVYKLPKRFIREHGGEVDWRGSRWYVTRWADAPSSSRSMVGARWTR
jgi:hypothetical protein